MSCIIHVGHDKTGTSSIQSYLAAAAYELEKLGINYSHHSSFDYASEGKVTSGNGSLLLEKEHIVKPNSLYSSEGLFRKLASDELLKQLLDKVNGELKVILYTRDFFDYCSSLWGQAIKNGGYTEEYDHFMKLYVENTYLDQLQYWIGASDKFGFKLEIFNYSRHKEELIPHFLRSVLGESSEKLTVKSPVVNRIVNRSLTRSENEFLRQVNKFVGITTISDTLVYRLPGVKPQTPSIELEVYELVVKKISPIINRINKSIPPAEAIKVEGYEKVNICTSDNSSLYEFTKEQLESLAEGISKQVMSIDAVKLRDIALKYDKKSKLDVSDALYLMTLAKQAKPMGPQILRKIDEYNLELASKSRQSASNKSGVVNRGVLYLKNLLS